MSTILRALRRLEEEKAVDELLELHDSVVAAGPPPAPRRGRAVLFVALAGVLAAALGAGVTWQLLGSEAGPPALAARDIPIQPPSDRALESALEVLSPDTAILVDAKDRRARLAPVAAPPPERRPAEAPWLGPEISSEVVIHRRKPPPAAAVAAPAPEAEPVPGSLAAAWKARTAQRSEPRPDAAAHSVPEGPVAAAPIPAREPAQPVAQAGDPTPRWREAAPAPTREPELRASQVVDSTPPELPPVEFAAAEPPAEPATPPRRKPSAAASGIPNVIVTKTVWHPRPERRSAVVEVEGSPGSLDLKEGDVVGDLVLTKIKPSGVVFDYEGVELVRKIGTSP